MKLYHNFLISSKEYAGSIKGHSVQPVPTVYTTGNPFTDYEYDTYLAADVQAVYSEYVYTSRKANGDPEIELFRMIIV